jgi:hypothetical protein
MTPKSINLNKLLKLFELQDQPLVSALRAELRAERDKMLGYQAGGGDFHAPFWFDSKLYVQGLADLGEMTTMRVQSSKQRQRLYPLLRDGFLRWFDGVRRSTNQRVSWDEANAHNHYLFPELDLTVKVDNLLSLRFGEESFRLVYPYFSERPILSERWARVGLWVMTEALAQYSITDMEIVDVLRGRGFRGSQVFLKGDEEALFNERYEEIAALMDELRPEYQV